MSATGVAARLRATDPPARRSRPADGQRSGRHHATSAWARCWPPSRPAAARGRPAWSSGRAPRPPSSSRSAGIAASTSIPTPAPCSGRARRRRAAFFAAVERWHRTLGEPLGARGPLRAIAAAANLLFLLLVVTGLFLWLPRSAGRGRRFGRRLLFRRGLRGRARDWNWHNVAGIWCALPLLLITLTGVVISYPWANALLFRLAGSPAAGTPGGRTAAATRGRRSRPGRSAASRRGPRPRGGRRGRPAIRLALDEPPSSRVRRDGGRGQPRRRHRR